MEFVSNTSIVGVGSVSASVGSEGLGHVGRGLNVVVVSFVDDTVTSGVTGAGVTVGVTNGVSGNFTVGGSFGIVGTFAGVSGVGAGVGVVGHFGTVDSVVLEVTSHIGFVSSTMVSSSSSSNSNSIMVGSGVGVGVGDGILTAGMVGASGSLSSS